MSQESLLYIMTAAVVVSAAAIVIQMVLLFAMFLASRAMKTQVTTLVTKVEPLTETAQHLMGETRQHVGELTAKASEISSKAAEILDLGRKELTRVDEVLGEATARTRAQMDRIEMVIDDTVNRFQETTTLLQSGILRPLRQLNGLTAGVRTALAVLFSGHRTTVEQATHDEEMFI